mgnify:CR=1 FL=1
MNTTRIDRGFSFQVSFCDWRGRTDPVIVKAIGTATTGIVIHESINSWGEMWALSHLHSGKRIAYAPSLRLARLRAGMLGGFAVRWNSPEPEVMADWKALSKEARLLLVALSSGYAPAELLEME